MSETRSDVGDEICPKKIASKQMPQMTNQKCPKNMTFDEVMLLDESKILANKKEFPQTMGMLKSKRIWIADTGASNHVSFSEKRSKNKRLESISQAGLVGEATESKVQLDLPGSFCDKYRDLVLRGNIMGVSYNPKSNFNLFSITKMLMRDRKLSGDKSKIKINKDNIVITFDIVIPTRMF